MDKNSLGNLAAGVGKSAKNLLEKSKEYAIKKVDQNDNGKLDLQDLSFIADSMETAVKQGAYAMMENLDEQSRKKEFNILQPIFSETLEETDFSMPKLIRVCERDKKHADSEVCQGSIGYFSILKSLRVVNIFLDSVDSFNVTFVPECGCNFYYADPTDRDQYIAVDNYFEYLKEARINELKGIVQSLGAKYFKVSYKEEQKSKNENKIKGKVKVAKEAAEGSHEQLEKSDTFVEIVSELEFPGHEPEMPKLQYLQKEPFVQALVTMRMNKSTPLKKEKHSIKFSNSSGIKQSDALKIDAALKGVKGEGNASFAKEAENETRKYLEYEIYF